MDLIIDPSKNQQDNTSTSGAIVKSIRAPGDKSISHRAAILGALLEKEVTIQGFSAGDDCLATLNCLHHLGANWRKGSTSRLTGGSHHISISPGALNEPEEILDAKNSGTTARLLMGVLSGLNVFACLTGDASLKRRPMDRVIKPLEKIGYTIKSRNNNRQLPAAIIPGAYFDRKTDSPIKIKKEEADSIQEKIPEIFTQVASAQVKSAILLAGLTSNSGVTVTEPHPTRDHTERMLFYLGADIFSSGKPANRVHLAPNQMQQLRKSSITQMDIPGDISSAAFLMALAVMVSGKEITITNTGINPTRTGFLDIIKTFGGNIAVSNEQVYCGEPRGDITANYTDSLTAVHLGRELVPGAIDELPLVAVLATKANGTSTVSGAEELRYKESDRIKAIVNELKKMGGKIEELKDGFRVTGPNRLHGATVHSYGDHRIAMALSVAAASAQGRTIIKDAACVSISYPDFESDLRKLGINANITD